MGGYSETDEVKRSTDAASPRRTLLRRALASPGDASPAPPADRALQSNPDVVNFSRKRDNEDQTSPPGKGTRYVVKRQRSADWSADLGGASLDRNLMSTPMRPSRFQEGSMHDKPSFKPPSVFTRHFERHVGASVEELLDDYHTSNYDKPLPPPPTAETMLRARGNRLPGRKVQTLHSKPDMTDHLDDPGIEMGAGIEEPRTEGGISKFGRTMATAFNPVSVWNMFTTGWRSAKQEQVVDPESARRKELDERQKRAEHKYAEMKNAGKLETRKAQTIHRLPDAPKDGKTSGLDESQRDSGIAMSNRSLSSVDVTQHPTLAPPDDGSRGRASRSPSLRNLRSMTSDFNLPRRSASSSKSEDRRDIFEPSSSPRRSRSRGNIFDLFQGEEGFDLVRSSSKGKLLGEEDSFGSMRSKKGMAKQVKLTKRVSDLEAKLNSARRELDKALGVPIDHDHAPALEVKSTPRSEVLSKARVRGGFVPQLPTLLSESLLFSDTSAIAIGNDGRVGERTHASLNEEPLQQLPKEASDQWHHDRQLSEDTQIFRPTTETIWTPARKSDEVPDAISTISDQIIGEPVADTCSLTDGSPKSNAKPSARKPSVKRRRVSKEEREYKPEKEGYSDDDGDEWEGAKPKLVKKKRRTGDDLPGDSFKRTKSSKIPVSTESPKARATVKSQAENMIPTKPMTSASTPLKETVVLHAPLDTVPEEARLSFTGPTTSPPSQAAVRTPQAHSSSARRLPSKWSRQGSRRLPKTTPKPERDQRSLSPPPSSSLGRLTSEDHDVKTAKPNGRDIPPMPNFVKTANADPEKKPNANGDPEKKPIKRESFEWPDDVF